MSTKLARWIALTFRWFGTLCFVLIGLPFLLFGLFIAFNTDWQPTTELRDNGAVLAADTFVQDHKANTGRLPTKSEFARWAKSAPSELRLDGTGFTYEKRGDDSYSFSWWGGNSWLSWEPARSHAVSISERDYFLFGSKFLDLLVFFGFAAGAFWAAKSVAPTRKPSQQ